MTAGKVEHLISLNFNDIRNKIELKIEERGTKEKMNSKSRTKIGKGITKQKKQERNTITRAKKRQL